MPNPLRTRAGLRPYLIAYLLLAAVSSATICSRTPAQTSVSATAANESDIRVAYVAVLDKKGTPIADLKAEDFSITEDKIPQQVVSVSSSADSHLVLGVMIDVSGSTVKDSARHDKFNVLLRFLGASVGGSEDAYVVAFAATSLRVTGSTANISELLSALKQVDEAQPSGPTALFDFLVSTANLLPPRVSGRSVLVVLSDFEDNTSHQDLDRAIHDLQLKGIALFALVNLERGHESDRSVRFGVKVAGRMTEETGGQTFLIRSPQDMEVALHRMQLLLKNSYALSYHATAKPRKDGIVPLKIETHRKDVQLVFSPLRPPPAL